MGYSKESERQNKALGDLLSGKTPEKRVMVGYKGKEQESGDQISRLSDIMKEARMPMFCPKCDVVMKKRLDDRMWYLYGHCFNCQVKVENKLRIEGKFDQWSHKKIIANKLSWIKDQKEEIKSFRNQKSPEFLQQINPDGHSVDKEKWEVDVTQVRKQADEALEYLQKIEDSLK